MWHWQDASAFSLSAQGEIIFDIYCRLIQQALGKGRGNAGIAPNH